MSFKTATPNLKALSGTLLDIGTILMISGASTGRIRNTVDRISNSFGYTTDMLISQRTLMLNIHDTEGDYSFNSLKRTAPHDVNLEIVSGISRMSWNVVEQKWSIEQINIEIKRLNTLVRYPKIGILIMVALAGASFCRIAGGGPLDMFMVFFGSFSGLLVKQKAIKKRFNPYICTYLAALTSSLIAGSLLKFDPEHVHEHALATSILFLIPGIPLINSFSDMIDGNLQNGLMRGLNGFILSFSIALGLLTSMFIYQI